MDYELLTTIVQQAQNGEKGALEQLYHETYNRVYFYAYKIFGNENDAAGVRDENAPVGSQLNPMTLELGASISEIPQVGDKLWMEYTPQSTGYYCFDAYFDGKFHGKNAELTTWAGAASYGSTLFKGACTVGMGEKSVAGKNLQEHYLYFTNDSILEAGIRYTICLEFEKGIAPEKLLLIQADMPF